MQRTIWDWLGIERTTDKSLIKKAYARQAKKYHPEELPEEAQALRRAYKDAMALASASEGHADDACAASAIYAPQPETVPEAELEYTYKSPRQSAPVPETVPEAELEYTYKSPKQSAPDPETVPEAELEYTYKSSRQSAPDPETVPEAELEYTYRSSRQSAPVPEAEPEYTYQSSRQSGMQLEPDTKSAPEYCFTSAQLPPDRAKRVADLKNKLETIYGSDYRDFASYWRQAFADYLEPEDLKDLRAVWEIFLTVEPMQRLKGVTWEIIQEELFRFQEDTAPWQLLRERFNAARRYDTNTPGKTPAAAHGGRGTNLAGTVVIVLLVFYVGMCLSTLIEDMTQESRRQKVLELQRQEVLEELREQVTEQIIVDTHPVPVSRETFQNTYTQEAPWELDLDGDRIPEHIYYDSGEGLFMVELYNTATEGYDSCVPLSRYLEENPETGNREILSYLAGSETGE